MDKSIGFHFTIPPKAFSLSGSSGACHRYLCSFAACQTQPQVLKTVCNRCEEPFLQIETSKPSSISQNLVVGDLNHEKSMSHLQIQIGTVLQEVLHIC